MLYERGTAGATYDEISSWVRPKMRKNLRRSLNDLVHERAWLHEKDDCFKITKLGIGYVEKQNLHHVT